MHYYEVAPNQIIRAASPTFTYASLDALEPGQLVIIEIGKKQLPGVIIRQTAKPAYDTKLVLSSFDLPPLPYPLVNTALWMSDYYATHLATVLQTLLPRGLQKTRRKREKTTTSSVRERTNIVFTPDQLSALSAIDSMTPGSALLHGITGSGKTSVYIEQAKRTLSAGRSVIVLVPEIALTSQLVDEFSHHFDDIILTHSRQTEAERHIAWLDALTSSSPRIAIGPRSALFTPLASVGLIVIDEAHEPSFKQEQSPRYSALRAASILVKNHEGKLILGSATPAISDYYLAQASSRPVIEMKTRAKSGAVAPDVSLVDMTKRNYFKKHRFFSDALIEKIERTLLNNEQALVFHNRRGSASTTLCENCGWSAICPRCFVPYTLHADTHQLRCHICGHTERVPTSCPECHSADIIHKGIGTKLIESEIKKIFPKAIVARFDGDTESGESVDQRYKDLYDGKIDIIIGTQVIAKGLDLPKLRTVGVVQADAGLSLPDYGSSERTFQLLAQVIGRVGRSHHPTNVVVQSYQPSHPAVVYGIAQDYESFYKTVLVERKKAGFPPFAYLLKLVCVYKTEQAAIKNSRALARDLAQKIPSTVQILGPTPAFYERQHDTYRWQIVLKSSKRADLLDSLKYVPPTHWQYEIDPLSLL